MRCNRIQAFFAGALIFAHTANAQQIPPSQQIDAPNIAPAGNDAKPAASGALAAEPVTIGSKARSAANPNVITLSQAASSSPGSAPSPAPMAVPPIVENVELATGKNSRKLDAAGPSNQSMNEPRATPTLVLQRVSFTDDEPRALIKIHGVLRYVQVGSHVLKKVVSSISAEGICLNSPEKSGNVPKERKAKAGPPCAQLVTFQSDIQ